MPSDTASARAKKAWWIRTGIDIALLCCLTLALYCFRLESVPNGFYADEASNGNHVAAVAQAGHTEYGDVLPVYFKGYWQFDYYREYNNPVYIYTAIVLAKVFGSSIAVIRATGGLFAAGSVALCYLIGALLMRRRSVGIASAFLLMLMPWNFDIARVVFEVGSGTFFVLAAVLFFGLWSRVKERSLFLLLGTAAMGILVYTYASSRLYSVLLMAVFFLVHAQFFWRHKLMAAKAAGLYALLMVPCLWYLFTDPVFIHRFQTLSVLGQKGGWSRVLETYGNYLKPDFLLLHGDGNPRHHSFRDMGQILPIHMVLSLAGMAALALKKQWRWLVLAIATILIYPIPGATTGETHALRGFLGIGLFTVLSSYGWHALSSVRWRKAGIVAVVVLSLVGLTEARTYLNHYFTEFPREASYGEGGFNKEEKDIAAYVNAHGGGFDQVIITEKGRRQPNVSPVFESWYLPPDIRAKVVSPVPTSGSAPAGSRIMTIVTPDEVRERSVGNTVLQRELEKNEPVASISDGNRVLFDVYQFTASP